MRDVETIQKYFIGCNRRSNFFYDIDLDDESCLRNVFWMDAKSRAMYESFADVSRLNTT